MSNHRTSPRKLNRLAKEKSPYLLQHAGNPIDWYPWGDEVLKKAAEEGKPIFISIGYSTCHWCHVMAHESFEDPAVAQKLNKDFISIKVDREERPDLDAGFMHACQLMTRNGGWPLNLFLTSKGKPFYAMTYAPKHSAQGRPGFIEILDKVAELWHVQPESLVDSAEQLSQAMLQIETNQEEMELDGEILQTAARNYRKLYDPLHAGFGQAPKFPQPHNMTLLLRLSQLFTASSLQQMALTTLAKIDQGGITDQLGGGLHRYSVDECWLVPHFEKMLYDQALIADAYLDAWQSSNNKQFKHAAIAVLDYVLRELQSPQGSFFCGEDADSEGVEGTYYVWTEDELRNNLTATEFTLFQSCYNISKNGVFEGKNIPHRSLPCSQLATGVKLPETDLQQQLNAINKKLLTLRNRRPHPHLDDKILAAWNGLMIGSLARAGNLLQRPDYLLAAGKAVHFIRSQLFTEGKLKRRYRAGETAIDAFHDDYAFLIWGLLELFLARSSPDDLKFALQLAEQLEEKFSDGHGGYFDAAEEFISGLGRGRNKQDGATPAAASVTAHNWIRLARLTADEKHTHRARRLISGNLFQAADHPTAHAFLLQALELFLTPEMSLIVISQGTIDAEWRSILRQFRPQLLTIITADPESLSQLTPLTVGKTTINDQTTAWFCKNRNCFPAVTDPAALQDLLQTHAPLKTFNR